MTDISIAEPMTEHSDLALESQFPTTNKKAGSNMELSGRLKFSLFSESAGAVFHRVTVQICKSPYESAYFIGKKSGLK